MKIKKIIVNKNDEAAEVVEKIIDSGADEVVLSIPRFSRLVESLANFNLIKREALLLEKKVIIESIDDKAIELASMAKLESVNPFFQKSKRISDIVVKGSRMPEPPKLVHRQPSSAGSGAKIHKNFSQPIEPIQEPHDPTPARVHRREVHLPSGKRILVVLGIAAVLISALYIMIAVLPRGTVTFVSAKSPWNYNDSIIVDKLAATISVASGQIPGQVFSQNRNVSLSFPASGKKQVEKKAGGRVTIYNGYSSEPQLLVATTRLLTPEGKVFRLVSGVTVPGAKIVEGKIVPSMIETQVIADQAGTASNIPPVKRFVIPGLKGTPKFDAFYAESKEAMTGGFVGEVAFPTDADIKTAKTELTKTLEAAVKTVFVTQMPAEFKIIPGAMQLTYAEPKVTTDVDQVGKFSIYGEATGSVIAFQEADVKEFLKQRLKKDLGAEFEPVTESLDYGEARADLNRGRASFPVLYTSTVARAIDADALKVRILGKTKEDLQSVVFSVPGLESAHISLWPFWVRSVPTNAEKVKVVIE